MLSTIVYFYVYIIFLIGEINTHTKTPISKVDVYSYASVIRTPIIWTLHILDKFLCSNFLGNRFCTINPAFQDPDPNSHFFTVL